MVIFDNMNNTKMLIYYYSIVLALAISSSGAAAESSIRGIGDKLFEFGDCTDDDYANTPYYVSPSGNNWNKDNGWGLSPDMPFKSIQFAVNNKAECQTIYVMEGTYRNNNYGNSKNNNAKIVNLNNVSNLKIIADPDASNMPLLQFDGAGGIFGGSASSPISNIEIAGLEIQGPNADITYEMAMADRKVPVCIVLLLIKSAYYTGRGGIAIWGGHHLYIHDMKVHDCPNAGIRVNKGDYVTIANSEVYDNTWWSSSAESAVVLAESVNIDKVNGSKMKLTGNTVYGNVNKIPYYNPGYKWDYSPIGGLDCSSYEACEVEEVDGCPWQCRYGKKTQDYIIDGQGVYVTRNNKTYLHGQMELSDNVAYGNGINGVVFHRTDRGVVQRNQVYNNGVVPVLDHPEGITEEWQENLKKSRQPYSGIVINNAKSVKLWSNNVMARYDSDYAFKIESDGSPYPLAAGGNNKACRGKIGLNLISYVKEVSDDSICTASDEVDDVVSLATQ